MRIVDLPADSDLWGVALPVLQELRPHLSRSVLDDILIEAAPQGLAFIGAFDGDTCVGVAGWRVIANTSAVRKAYVDDLVTAASTRSRGVGALLLDDIEQRARQAQCHVLDLDSGVQRFDAHRFYLRERMSIQAHHFVKAL
nr:GNAT family N-acetyltransferase [Microbacterium amylolyticum]